MEAETFWYQTIKFHPVSWYRDLIRTRFKTICVQKGTNFSSSSVQITLLLLPTCEALHFGLFADDFR